MKIRSLTGWLIGACLVFGAPSLFAVAAVSAEKPPDDRALYADVAGRVVDDVTGEPVPGIAVSLLYESVITGPDGSFLFQKIPMIHSAQVSMRVSTDEGLIIGCTTFDVPVRFYPVSTSVDDKVDIEIVEPGVDKAVELRVKSISVKEINKYCQQCHLANPCVETATFSSVVKTSRDLRGLIIKESQLPKYREQLKQKGVAKDSYMKIRYQDTHPDGMDMTESAMPQGQEESQFQIPVGLKTSNVVTKSETMRFIVCDTCHTRHEPTAQRQFVVMSYEEDSKLCYQCHK